MEGLQTREGFILVGDDMPSPRSPGGRGHNDDQFRDHDNDRDGGIPTDAGMPTRRRRGPGGENPIRKIVSETLAVVDAAVTSNFREPARIGFGNQGGEPVDVRQLMTQLEATTLRLGMVIQGISGPDQLSSAYRTFAQSVKNVVLSFRLYLQESTRDGTLSDSQRLEFVSNGVEVCKGLAGLLHQFDNFQAQNGLAAA